MDGLNARLCILKAEAFRRLQVQRFGAIQENFRVGLGVRDLRSVRDVVKLSGKAEVFQHDSCVAAGRGDRKTDALRTRVM